MTAEKILAQLRDIHHPSPVPFWPLAPGWYALILLVSLVIGFIVYSCYRYIRKHRVRKIVLMRLEQLQQQQEDMNVPEALSMLLKRAALFAYPRKQVAGLFGEQWLAFLDKTAMTSEFSAGLGRVLITYPYKNSQEELPEALFLLIKQWVKRNL